MYDQFVFVEKYRPRKISDTILPDRITEIAQSMVEKGEIPNLLLSGSAGIGKTTLVMVLARMLDYEYLLINCSDEGRFMDTFRNRVANFATAISIDGRRKCLILDEIDNLTHDVQSLLRGFIEKHSGNCSFVATCNFPHKLMDPLRSRFGDIDFNVTNAEKKKMSLQFFNRCCHILDNEAVTYDKNAVAELVGKFFPDFRKVINELQKYAATGKIDSGIFAGMSSDMDELFTILKARRWSEMRKWVAQQQNLDMSLLCRTMFARADTFFVKDSIPSLVMLLDDAQYKNAFCIDKEIHLVATLTQIMSECEML